MAKTRAILLAVLVVLVVSKQTDRVDPVAETYEAEAENIHLALTERLTIPLFGAISKQIEYVPKNAGECKFTETLTKYKEVAQRNIDRHEGTLVTSILTLASHELVFTIDQYFFLSVYSLKLETALKEQVSSRKIIAENSTAFATNPKLVATPNESVVYVLSPYGYSYFYVDSLSTEIKKVSEEPLSAELYEGLAFNGHLYLACGAAGIGIYRIEGNHDLKRIGHMGDWDAYDIKIDQIRKLLYVLDFMKGIFIYDISEPTRPTLYDSIRLENITTVNTKLQVNGKTILVQFFKNQRNIIAELSYDHALKSFTFIRYFKMKAAVNEIHLMDTHFIAIGYEFMGIFPVGVHPKLIRQELNGYVALSPIKTSQIYQPPFFVGITETSIILGMIDFDQKETVECILDENSTLKKIIYKANLTTCGEDLETRSYYNYCAYEKEFHIKRMEIVAHAGIANLVWVLLLVFASLFGVGIVFLFIMRAKKVSKIRKMEIEFEQKRTNVALPSARMTDRIGSDART